MQIIFVEYPIVQLPPSAKKLLILAINKLLIILSPFNQDPYNIPVNLFGGFSNLP